MTFPFEMVPFFEDMLIFRWVYLVSRLEGMYSSSSVEGSFAGCKMCDLIWKHGFGLWLPKRPFSLIDLEPVETLLFEII